MADRSPPRRGWVATSPEPPPTPEEDTDGQHQYPGGRPAPAGTYHARMTDREVTAQRELDAATANRRAAAELLADLKEDA